MKKNILTLITMAIGVLSLNAQTDTLKTVTRKAPYEINTLFKSEPGPVNVGFYVGPGMTYTQFKGKDVYMAEFSAGVIFNHQFSVGFRGNGIMNSQNLRYDDIQDTTDGYLYGGCGGWRLEYILNPEKPVHFSFPLTIGGGGLMYSAFNMKNMHGNNNQDENTIDSDAFFIVEPGAMISLNLTRFMRFDAGVSYRFAPNVNLINTSSSIMNNFNGCFSLKFGKF